MKIPAMAKAKRTWAIEAYEALRPQYASIIESSRGRPYAELKTLARKLCFNGTGDRFRVVETFPLPEMLESAT